MLDDLPRILPALAMAGIRFMPFVALAPFMALAALPWITRLAVVAILAVSVAIGCPEATWSWSGAALELAVGIAFAAVAHVPLWALEIAGRATEALGPRSPWASRLYLWTGTALFFGSGAHRLALHALLGSVHSVPLGAMSTNSMSSVDVIRWTTQALTLGVSIATPMLMGQVWVDLGFAWMRWARDRWEGPVSIRFATTLALSMLMLAALVPRFGRMLVDSIRVASQLFAT